MATLFDQQIDQTYQGLIKTTDNAALGAVEKEITDGVGTSSTLKLGTTSASFVGTLDLTGATVTGLPVVTAGLVAGTGADSMQSDASLTTTAPSTIGVRSIALGNNARANAADTVAIGSGVNGEGSTAVVLGINSWSQSNDCIAIGNGAHARLGDCISIGRASQAADNRGIAIGQDAKSAVGVVDAIAFGTSSRANATGAVALGNNVTAAIIDTVSMKALEVQTDSTPTAGGIIMIDAGSTARRLNITAAGALQIDSTPVGGGAAGLEAGTGTSSLQSAAALTTTAANASANQSIAIGDGAIASSIQATAIGKGCEATALETTAIGNDCDARQSNDLAVGRSCVANGNGATAMGANSNATGGASVAIGNSATATAYGAIALGNSVTAAIADTLSIKALETQTNSTPTAGGIIMADAGGTDRRINIDATGALQIDSTPVGGGGGSDTTPILAARPTVGAPFGNNTDVWSNPWLLSGYTLSSLSNNNKIVNNGMWMVPVTLKEGLAFRTMKVNMQTGGGSMNVGLYKATAINGVLFPEYAATIATNVDVSTGGFKTVLTSGNVVIPASPDSRYFLAFQLSDITATFKVWSQTVSQNNISQEIYRINAVACSTPTTFNLPTGALTTSTDFVGTTSGAIDVQWQYV